ncbi:hypothetical protein KO528_13535 [Saccharophagus degradans]|uniref:hypothetical protein n=1 Tax=Saccharophagus degradans TaxID=86304 RepID=UPI001C0A0672|nr:hypothetical protein [Saccharophagus degradans]MBU2986378.1 hypothetical protein [Saccharophagus degradans]
MNRTLILIVLSLFSIPVLSISIEGTWQEDKGKTLRWNSENGRLSESHLANMEKILGNLFVTYKNGRMCQYSKPYEVFNDGNVKSIKAYIPEYADYNVLAGNESGFVIRTVYTEGAENITMHIFESENSMYGVVLSTEDYGYPGSRTYFKKVEPVKWESVCEY